MSFKIDYVKSMSNNIYQNIHVGNKLTKVQDSDLLMVSFKHKLWHVSLIFIFLLFFFVQSIQNKESPMVVYLQKYTL